MTAPRTTASVTCLGCGCACDDITVTTRNDTIVDTDRACALGRAWFGDGRVPMAVISDGHAVSLDDAVAQAANLLGDAASRVAVYIGTEISCETQRVALALADALRGTVDSSISTTAAAGLLSAQRQGRASATLGEIRNRADLVVFWGVDPAVRYPRFLSRYALDPVGTHVPQGRAGRTAVSVTVGADRGPADADITMAFAPSDEVAALAVMRALVLGRRLDPLPAELSRATDLVEQLMRAKYVVFVHDAEPDENSRDAMRVDGLIALVQALNGPTRAALCSLRGGGNRSGADATFTWQTGYPFSVTFNSGAPQYRPRGRILGGFGNGSFDAALLVGAAIGLDPSVTAALKTLPTVAIGPRASEAAFEPRVAIDTGIAGIHEGGTAYRMDEVPLPLRATLSVPQNATTTLSMLLEVVRARRGRGS